MKFMLIALSFLSISHAAQAQVNSDRMYVYINREVDAAAVRVIGQHLDPDASFMLGGASGQQALAIAIPRILKDVPGLKAPVLDRAKMNSLFSSTTNADFLAGISLAFAEANGF
jgi:hypothetical protein